ncbi:sigma-70 family RNA polymerase sigma factor [Nocardia coubleae]|uniref:sigma-70 family RNA polymerase sigma factor n=1 Tax=Nocardia coubleae TaxID=356147 RepID=UPI000ABE76A1|nr:sigma-70 family RNA polymerase sigma factor [Nocardia coubleae]
MAETFEAQRDRLRTIAYRVLGSYADAEDVVQEAWLRLVGQDTATIDNLAGWLTTVVSHISLDLLRSRKARPETGYGQEFPGFVVTPADGPTPDEQVALADSVGLALFVVLDTLSPSERVAFVLHDMFAVSFSVIGQILGKSTDASKMIASRARRKVQATDHRAGPGREHRNVVQAFRAAALAGDFEALLRILDPQVKLTVDTADGVVVTLGATAVASGARMFSGEVARQRPVLVNGVPGHMSWQSDGTPLSVIAFAFTVTDGLIAALHIVIDPAKLASIRLPEPPLNRRRRHWVVGPRLRVASRGSAEQHCHREMRTFVTACPTACLDSRPCLCSRRHDGIGRIRRGSTGPDAQLRGRRLCSSVDAFCFALHADAR